MHGLKLWRCQVCIPERLTSKRGFKCGRCALNLSLVGKPSDMETMPLDVARYHCTGRQCFRKLFLDSAVEHFGDPAVES